MESSKGFFRSSSRLVEPGVSGFREILQYFTPPTSRMKHDEPSHTSIPLMQKKPTVTKQKKSWVVVSYIFYFQPLFGEINQFD